MAMGDQARPAANPDGAAWALDQLVAVLDGLDEAVTVMDEDLVVREVNAAAVKQFGKARAGIVGRSLWAVRPDLADTEFRSRLSESLRRKRAASFEQHASDGPRETWVEHRFVPASPGLAWFCRDITARKQTEAMLAASEARLRRSQAATGVGAYEVELATGRLQLSGNAQRLFDLPEGEAPTLEEVLERVHPEDRAHAILDPGRPEDFAGYAEYRVVQPGGAVRWIGRQAGVVYDAAGRPERLAGALRDITERRQEDEQIRFQARVLDDLGQAVIATDATGIVVYWNKAAENLYGWTAAEAMGRSVIDLKTGPSEAAEAKRLLSALMAGEHWAGELQLTRRNGQTFLAHVSDSPIRDSEGQLIGIVGVSYDISERKRAQDHLTLMVDELNHRVKNTLATVQSVAAQTLRGHDIPAEVREALTSRLVALSRAHDVLTDQQWAGGDLRAIVAQAADPYETPEGTRFSFHGPSVQLEPKTAIAVALALHELTTNAVKYGALSTPGGQVTVDWTVTVTEAQPELSLTWRERGGPTVKPPSRKGFGSRLIARSLPQELNGAVDLEYPPSGVVCRIRARLPARVIKELRPKFVIYPDENRWVVSDKGVSQGEFESQRRAIAFVSRQLEQLRLSGRGGTVVFQNRAPETI